MDTRPGRWCQLYQDSFILASTGLEKEVMLTLHRLARCGPGQSTGRTDRLLLGPVALVYTFPARSDT